jgi:hypothetical protein
VITARSAPRNPRPKYVRFQVSFAVARDHLLNELRLMGARNLTISSNVPLRRDGLPYANQGTVEDAGVAAAAAGSLGDAEAGCCLTD